MTRTRLGESENDCREASIRFTTYWSDPVKRISREFDFFLNERNRSLSENIPNRAKAAKILKLENIQLTRTLSLTMVNSNLIISTHVSITLKMDGFAYKTSASISASIENQILDIFPGERLHTRPSSS